MTAGTISHISPYFEPLKLLASRNHTIYFASTTDQLSFVKEYSFFHLYDLGSCEFKQGLDERLHQVKNRITPRDMVSLKDMTLTCYGQYVSKYKELLSQITPDLMFCDFFADACIDVAVSMDLKLAVSGVLGILGFGSDWFIPPFYSPTAIQEWAKSPWTRFNSHLEMWMEFPTMMKAAQKHKELQKEFGIPPVPVDRTRIFSSCLYLCHTLFGFYPARSLPPNVIAFGPIIKNKKESSSNSSLNLILDQYNEKQVQVVYIAFGSKAGAGKQLIHSICQTISLILSNPEYNIAFIWANKNSDSCIQELHDSSWKVNVLSWVNQKELLSHPSIKVFVTHGGISSIHEAIYYGKPLIVNPFFGDQFYNAKVVQDAGIGRELQRDFTPQDLVQLLVTMMYEMEAKTSLLQSNLLKLQSIAKYNSQTHLLSVADMIEMVADVGVEHLVPYKPGFYDRYGLHVSILSSLLLGYMFIKLTRWK